MKLKRRTKLLVEPPSVATGDIAFNLIVFFLVCASTAPDRGRRQDIPASDTKAQQQTEQQNLEVELSRAGVKINDEAILLPEFATRIRAKLADKKTPEERVVIVTSGRNKDVPYHHWIKITGDVEDAGGIITLQLVEDASVQIPD